MKLKPKEIEKKTVDEYLDEVSYTYLNSASYKPTLFSLTYAAFIKMVNGEVGESHSTPPLHLAMMDKIGGLGQYIVNLCFRGAAKTTLMAEYLFLYAAAFGFLPGIGKVEAAIYIGDSMENGVKSLRKNIQHRYDNSAFLRALIPEATFTENYIEFKNIDGHKFAIKMFGAKSGLRGTKIFGKRPTLCVMDDLMSDDDAKSKVAMESIKDTVYNGVNHAMDPTNRKIIFNGTPFNSEDVIIQAVESGEYDVNVWPVCETFPCEESEFNGAWEERFSYEYVLKQYNLAKNTGRLGSFYQELMLRISSADERLVQEEEIKWYSRADVLKNKHRYNFYFTTDFATSSKQTADYTVIAVWAYDWEGNWYWVDGICEKQTMDKTMDDLFKFVKKYRPQQVGVEINGQQGGFIPWIQKEMNDRDLWFAFASNDKAGNPGIRTAVDKLTKFNLVVPYFKQGQMFFPKEMKSSKILKIGMGQIKLATAGGIKGKDDFIDATSMLAFLKPWTPDKIVDNDEDDESGYWATPKNKDSSGPMSSYVV